MGLSYMLSAGMNGTAWRNIGPAGARRLELNVTRNVSSPKQLKASYFDGFPKSSNILSL